MSTLPKFNEYGNLPPGIHIVSWQDVYDCLAFNERRQELLAGLKRACESLKKAGCCRVYIGGSFVTDKEYPGDFDACWDDNGVELELLDPVLLDFSNKRAAQKAKYGGELFLCSSQADFSGNTFLEFFQRDRNGNPKGIVAIDL
ncbi:hypothetical protein G7B40_023225 [Aetokthonos hydrillicola Thurmond2011]|jgi:hypothetical protein|uniref:Uncharacterized protein n=1 Tax=Aetokthonos hydrillicola Thurmond2011 TaxID=2712845 RepID=A0AAP5I9I7_9CYAN|nr:hypothetical protein [Aetokthonos hydrillicola]MBO3461075.1 hypothetical protein [Aetokthonos hydrillicola CCALA 1050]MBW4586329.1 hypothetical protein [Aetokthonos hydrillicola CCALA 1050]MDR9897457.1 hypothetical protein [Aetokthonos hydrillicola Thurmond2011]